MQAVKPYTTLAFLMTLLFICFIGLYLFAAEDLLYVYWFIIIGSITAMNIFSMSKNFILTLTIILLAGFLLLFYIYFQEFPLSEQIFYMLQHLLLTVSLLLMWMIFNQIEKWQEEMGVLKEKVKKLEKYEGSSKMLTPTEFNSRVLLISTATRRRGEENCYIRFTIDQNENTGNSLNYLLGEAILKTIRAEYDLVTEIEKGFFLVFLQNTQESSYQIVMDRLFKELRTQLKLVKVPVDYEIIKEKETGLLESWLEKKEKRLV